jgi:hypothetical protein
LNSVSAKAANDAAADAEASVARMTEAKAGVNTMDPHVAALVQATG